MIEGDPWRLGESLTHLDPGWQRGSVAGHEISEDNGESPRLLIRQRRGSQERQTADGTAGEILLNLGVEPSGAFEE